MRANIYSLERLPDPTREAIHDGLGMVAAYIGETVVAADLTVRLPQTPEGLVSPSRVGFGKLDNSVELHVMAVPLHKTDARVGCSYLGSGCSFVDVSYRSATLIRSGTAHESAHSIGFALPGTSHHSKVSENHCTSETCIMHDKLFADSQLMADSPLVKLITSTLFKAPHQIDPLAKHQYDFCADCKVDMRDKGQEQLELLRRTRQRRGFPGRK